MYHENRLSVRDQFTVVRSYDSKLFVQVSDNFQLLFHLISEKILPDMLKGCNVKYPFYGNDGNLATFWLGNYTYVYQDDLEGYFIDPSTIHEHIFKKNLDIIVHPFLSTPPGHDYSYINFQVKALHYITQ